MDLMRVHYATSSNSDFPLLRQTLVDSSGHSRSMYRISRRKGDGETGPLYLQVGDTLYLTKCLGPIGVGKNYHMPLPGLQTFFALGLSPTLDVLTGKMMMKLIHDDTFEPQFLSTLMIVGPKRPFTTSTPAGRCFLLDHGVDQVLTATTDLPTGPYLFHDHNLYSVRKLFDDPACAFASSVYPLVDKDHTFVDLWVSCKLFRLSQVAVSPMSYHLHGKSDPLRGLRFSIGDDFDLANMPTAAGNRDYGEFAALATENAEAVTMLLKRNMQLVGKTQIGSFGLMEYPTEAVDAESPFNPRGDGYQLICGGSCDGGAAAIATYKWLDVALCCDRMGSARTAASQAGVIAFRFSPGFTGDEGIKQLLWTMESVAVLVRHMDLLPSLLDALDLNPTGSPRPAFGTPGSGVPIEILWPVELVSKENPDQTRAFQELLADLAMHMGVKVRYISMIEDWRQSTPGRIGTSELPTSDLLEFFRENVLLLHLFNSNARLGTFRESFREQHGRDPNLTEAVKRQWATGSSVPTADIFDMSYNIRLFKEWFYDHYLTPHSILMVPGLSAIPRYRDQNNLCRHTDIASFLSGTLGVPELTVPIAQVQYLSSTTDQVESLPVSVSFISEPARDLALAKWVLTALERCGRRKSVETGGLIFKETLATSDAWSSMDDP